MDYCPSCGKPQQYYYNHHQQQQRETTEVTIPLPKTQTKDPGTAVLIALIAGLFGFQGIGHIYIGKAVMGLVLLITGWISFISAILFLFIGGIFISLAIAVAAFVFWILQAYDANRLAKYYNEFVIQNGKSPW